MLNNKIEILFKISLSVQSQNANLKEEAQLVSSDSIITIKPLAIFHTTECTYLHNFKEKF